MDILLPQDDQQVMRTVAGMVLVASASLETKAIRNSALLRHALYVVSWRRPLIWVSLERRRGGDGNIHRFQTPNHANCINILDSGKVSTQAAHPPSKSHPHQSLVIAHIFPRSDDYSSNKTSSPYKAILLNKVVVGKGYKVTENNTSLSAPPSGYDSVSLLLFVSQLF